MNETLLKKIDKIFSDLGRPLSADEITKELNKRGELPELWTVLDVADFMKEWYGNPARSA